MADYAAQAASIYDPQLQAEKTQEDAANAANQAAFGLETNNTNTDYADALSTAGKARDTAAANNDMVAQTHGLWTSGLAANAQRLTYQNYVDNATKIGTARAAKLADIGSRQTAATQKYQADLGVLTSKYSGLKNSYIADHQNADAQAAAANAARTQAARIKASTGRAPTAAQIKAGAYGSLADDVKGFLSGYGNQGMGPMAKGGTEQVIAKLQNLYAGSGLSSGEIKDYVYQYRKANFGN